MQGNCKMCIHVEAVRSIVVSGVKRVVVSGAEVLWFQVTKTCFGFRYQKCCGFRCRSVVLSGVEVLWFQVSEVSCVFWM